MSHIVVAKEVIEVAELDEGSIFMMHKYDISRRIVFNG